MARGCSKKMEGKKAAILGSKVDIVDSKETLAIIEEIIRSSNPTQIVTLNAEIAYNAQYDSRLSELIKTAKLVTPDGIGIIWAGHVLGYKFKERVTGIDLVYSLCRVAAQKGYRVYLLGAAPGIAKAAGENLINEYPHLNICGTHHGYFTPLEHDFLVTEIKKRAPEILFVGLGAPKQEYWIKEHLQELDVPVCIGVGGSFDVIAGLKKRAPAVFIKLNLEWLYRLASEPKRLKRQLVLPKFIIAVIKQRLQMCLSKGKSQ